MNQFVPQLMLGNALANSTNHPKYNPHWIKLDTWHIGAQYSMGLCVKNETYPDGFECDRQTWLAKAATGKLVPVEPGEVVEASFELVEKENNAGAKVHWSNSSLEWHLCISVVDGGPDRLSEVVSDRPFMGLVQSTSSWNEDIYDNVYVGSCLENYGMVSGDNYPPEWQIDIKVRSPDAGSWWRDFRLEGQNSCPWQPQSQLQNDAGEKWQRAVWRAFL